MLEEMSTAQYLSFGILKVGGDNATLEINWYLVLYYVVCILIGVNVAGSLHNRGQPIAGIISILLLIMIFIFFGLRWFSTPDSKKDSKCPDPNNPSTSGTCPTFPPSINLCPDFMVAYTGPAGKVLCYDVNNTYEMKKATGALLLTDQTINGVGGQSAHTSGLDLVNTITNNQSSITGHLLGKYLRWEGVFDGRSFLTTIACITSKLAA